MHITLSPQRRDDKLVVIKKGDVLTINGEEFDFTDLPDGADMPNSKIPCDWLATNETIHRVNGELHLILCIPHGKDPSRAVAFPEPLINPPDGPLAIPFDPPKA